MVGAGAKLKTPVKGSSEMTVLSNSGAGVKVYVFDTGIRTTHSLFNGRAFNFQGMTTSLWTNDSMNDVIGHGTHVAGIAGALIYGTAQWATLVNVKVVNNNNHVVEDTLSEALDAVTTEHIALKKDPLQPYGLLVERRSYQHVLRGHCLYQIAQPSGLEDHSGGYTNHNICVK